MSPIPNQANFQDDQNFKIDINKVYADFIQEIDSSRSLVNVNANLQILNNINKKTLGGITQYLKIEDTAQESRCHAFYRLIGLPVVSSNGFKTYSPGLDIIMDPERTVTLDYKLQISKTPLKGFVALSNFRETYVNNFLNIFSLPSSIDAGALALSSGYNIRNFVAPLEKNKDTDPFDTVIDNQSYVVNYASKVGNQNVDLTEYQDASGNPPTKLTKKRQHIIIPFVVDSRIDFSVSPASRKICVPFALDKSNTMVGENTYVKRPVIEKIITERLTTLDQEKTLGTADKSLIDYIKNISAVKDQKVLDSINKGDIYQLNRQAQFNSFLNIINAMMTALVAAQNTVIQAQSSYYWVPVPSKNGPEQGSTVQGVFFNQNLSTKLITNKDRDILFATIRTASNDINSQTATLNGIPDDGNFTFNAFTTSFKPDTTGSLGNNAKNNLDDLIANRNKVLSDAGEALRTIEIIVGEFSGLGLCDIIAIMGALYFMPEEDLLGLIDTDAITRMNKLLNLDKDKNNELDVSNIETALTSLTSNVQAFYNLMDKTYKDKKLNNNKAKS